MQPGTAFLTGFGAFLPNAPVDNASIEKVLGEVSRVSTIVKKRILAQNGILTRHYAIDPLTRRQTHNNAQITVEAVRTLAGNTGFDLQKLDCLVCGTSAADQIIPSHGSMVHGELGIPPCEVATTAGVCCAGMTALKYGWLNVASGNCAHAIVTGSELSSCSLTADHFGPELALQHQELEREPTLAFENDFLRWMLSDGAGAVLVAKEPLPNRVAMRIDWLDTLSYANEVPVCMFFGLERQADGTTLGYRSVADPVKHSKGRFFNLGQDVKILKNVREWGEKAFRRVKQRRQLNTEHVEWFLPHFSSNWFRQPLYDVLRDTGLEIPYERWFTNLHTRGNTGSASIFIILDELASSGKIRSGDRLLCYVPESARMTFSLMHLTAA
jgi:3-oxoacyl-[acyl-carrier-protein] synthase-3